MHVNVGSSTVGEEKKLLFNVDSQLIHSKILVFYSTGTGERTCAESCFLGFDGHGQCRPQCWERCPELKNGIWASAAAPHCGGPKTISGSDESDGCGIARTFGASLRSPEAQM